MPKHAVLVSHHKQICRKLLVCDYMWMRIAMIAYVRKFYTRKVQDLPRVMFVSKTCRITCTN